MVQSKNILSLLVLPTLALCAPSRHAHSHAHHHKREGAVKEHWVYTTEVTHVTVYGNAPQPQPTRQPAQVNEVNANAADVEEEVEPSSVVEQPLTIQPSQPPASTQPPEAIAPEPIPEVEAPEQPSSGGGYPTGTGGKLTIQNNCDYDMTMTIVATMCGDQVPEKEGITIKAGSPWVGNIVSCEGANPTYKIYKAKSGSKNKRWQKDPNDPVQMEVGHNAAYGGTLWYNISLKDCMTDETGSGIENCAGGPWSLTGDSTAADKGACQSLSCSDKETCCQSNLGAYCDATATVNKAMTGPDNGLEPVGAALGSLEQVSAVAQLC